MHHEAFWLNASDATPLYVNRWFADEAPKAIVMIAHGMAEHSGRYARLGAALVAAGFELYAHDQRGHGRTAEHGRLGHYADANGWNLVLTARRETPLRTLGAELSTRADLGTWLSPIDGSYVALAVGSSRGEAKRRDTGARGDVPRCSVSRMRSSRSRSYRSNPGMYRYRARSATRRGISRDRTPRRSAASASSTSG